MRVMKFGGTSLSTPEHLETVFRLVEEAFEEGPVVLVTSAVAGVTDLLTGWVAGSVGSLTELEEVYLDLWKAVGPNREEPLSSGRINTPDAAFRNGLEGILTELGSLEREAGARGEWEASSRDRALAAGDRLAALLLSSALQTKGIAARPVEGWEVVRTDSTFGNARVDVAETRQLARQALGGFPVGGVPVVAGFSGGDTLGRPTILGRGTSDLTASLLASALSAKVVEIWTDVDGIHARDPRESPGSPLFSRLSYERARALAAAGAKVLHPRCLDPIQAQGIPLQVRNTLNPKTPGTLVSAEGEQEKNPSRVHLILAGATGGVGRAFLRQLALVAPTLKEEEGLDVQVAGAFSSQAQFWAPGGVPIEEVSGTLTPNSPPNWRILAQTVASDPPPNPVFVDCTASPEVSDRYWEILTAGIPVVTPNKLAASGALARYRALRDVAEERGLPYRYETTVGAALPILRTVRELRQRGDRFRSITGVLSGTLSFVFSKLAEGVSFSDAVREAQNRGFTEPHPREDLSGADVGRKLLILLREGGIEMESEAIPVESLVPEDLAREDDPETFLKGLRSMDEVWASRIRETGTDALAYVAWFDGVQAGVGVRSIPRTNPLASLRPTENMVVLETDQYPDVPLTIAGPGAGPEVTASGVLTDFLAAVRQRYGGSRAWILRDPSGPGAPPGGRRRVA